MTGIKTDDLKIDPFVTTAEMCRATDNPPTVFVKVDNRAATRQAVIVKLRREGFEFKTRSDWKAREAKTAGMKLDWSYTGIAIHHAGNSASCNADGAAQMRKVQDLHMDVQDYADVGYHYAVDCQGVIYEGRDIRYLGAHIGEVHGVAGIVLLADLSVRGEERQQAADRPFWKRPGFGIFTVDDADVAHDEPTGEQIGALEALVKALRHHFAIERLGGHREWAVLKQNDVRACPGVHGMIVVEMLRKDLKLGAPK
ncbi:peptidoglycan recognition family protein [Caldimonas brevitalea]|uniref:Peptidoglycan recognition protein family domain-containing protein n=1 Tax=Caldimonas brevitalea TaxID=413882 RepID=A0A0G3BHP3_9BURK|nr:peptidoglycan recognition family protein [Caldimonas brevitalea]AKJ28857.1 hypothetical protein AAW51_2166 [Caldimonas brevitalea]